ncbi:endolytic transglycosylase MltG [Aquabacter cavernae]|uniref:endolytic transglycosylase MltG n=1 Tax=Aquabacter cavernae TaxID=2496029 RepID=UPI000F8E2D73|nr:endolytic transglycosylase MltG [Aquabacter cavernae]
MAAPDDKAPNGAPDVIPPAPEPAPAESTPAAAPQGKPAKARGKAPAPAKAKKSRPSRSASHPAVVIGSAIFTFLLFLAVGGGLVAWYGQRQYAAPGPLAAEKLVFIPRGSGTRDIAEILEREGVVRNWLLFLASQQITHRGEQLQAGEYLFPPAIPLSKVIDDLVEGRVVVHQVTIPEGLTSQQILDRLNGSELLTGTPRLPQEGTLLPETYRITRGMRRDEVLTRMAAEQQKVVRDVWAKRDPSIPLKSPQELVILASIVEEETGKSDERAKVAAVFINRLNKKMKLQSDPTIIYGIAGGKGTLGRSITRTDIVTPTAYNTYTIDGLPPGPIGNPGKEALAAVANPAKTDDLYFVADGTGGHAFAKTLDQHNRNVAKWREIEAAQRAAQPPATTAPVTAPGAGSSTNAN